MAAPRQGWVVLLEPMHPADWDVPFSLFASADRVKLGSGLLLVLGTMAALSNAVVTSCIDSFIFLCPLLLLGLLQEMTAQQESRHLSHTNNMTYPAMVCSIEGMCFVPDLWFGEIMCSVLPCVLPYSSAGLFYLSAGHPPHVAPWSPQVVSAHLQKCHSVLSKNGYFLKDH